MFISCQMVCVAVSVCLSVLYECMFRWCLPEFARPRGALVPTCNGSEERRQQHCRGGAIAPGHDTPNQPASPMYLLFRSRTEIAKKVRNKEQIKETVMKTN